MRRSAASAAGSHCRALDQGGTVLRIAVAFFGLVRRIDHTLDGIEANLLEPLRERAEGNVDVFVHTLLRHFVTSANRFHAYAAEANITLGEADFLALKPCRYTAEDQRVVDLDQRLHERSLATAAYRRANARRLSLKRYTPSMLANVYRAYYSLRQAGKLIAVQEAARRLRYTHVVAARPDCAVLSTIAWTPPPQDTVVVPNYAHNSGVNDRFAYGRRSEMAAYMRRFDWLLSSTREVAVGRSKRKEGEGEGEEEEPVAVDALGNAIETEELVCMHLRASRLRVGVTPLCVVRVRATGVAVSEVLNKSKSRLGLPHLCAQRCRVPTCVSQRYPAPLSHLSLSSSAADEQWPCKAELRETRDGVTTFRSDVWQRHGERRRQDAEHAETLGLGLG